MAKVMTKAATVSHLSGKTGPEQEAGGRLLGRDSGAGRQGSEEERRVRHPGHRQGRPLEPEGAHGPQPADRRADQDRGQAGRAHPRRSRFSRTRSSARRSSAEHMPRSARRPVSPAAGPAPSVLEPRVWQGVVYQPCQAGAPAVRQLFHFAGALAPDLQPDEIAWEARAGGPARRRRALRATRRPRLHPRPGRRGPAVRGRAARGRRPAGLAPHRFGAGDPARLPLHPTPGARPRVGASGIRADARGLPAGRAPRTAGVGPSRLAPPRHLRGSHARPRGRGPAARAPVIVALAGGTGAAKLLRGLAQVTDPRRLFIVGNTGDDLDWWGLHVSPDLDSVAYGLAGLLDPARGWGVRDDTFHCLAAMARLGTRDVVPPGRPRPRHSPASHAAPPRRRIPHDGHPRPRRRPRRGGAARAHVRRPGADRAPHAGRVAQPGGVLRP